MTASKQGTGAKRQDKKLSGGRYAGRERMYDRDTVQRLRKGEMETL